MATCSGVAAGIYTVCAIGATSTFQMILWICCATVLTLTSVTYTAKARREKRVTPARDPRKLATHAQEQAAEAAQLGLPTGVWIDLAAAWTTWADAEDAERPVKAPSVPAERPKSPKGGGGAGYVSRSYVDHCKPCGIIWENESLKELRGQVREHETSPEHERKCKPRETPIFTGLVKDAKNEAARTHMSGHDECRL